MRIEDFWGFYGFLRDFFIDFWWIFDGFLTWLFQIKDYIEDIRLNWIEKNENWGFYGFFMDFCRDFSPIMITLKTLDWIELRIEDFWGFRGFLRDFWWIFDGFLRVSSAGVDGEEGRCCGCVFILRRVLLFLQFCLFLLLGKKEEAAAVTHVANISTFLKLENVDKHKQTLLFRFIFPAPRITRKNPQRILTALICIRAAVYGRSFIAGC